VPDVDPTEPLRPTISMIPPPAPAEPPAPILIPMANSVFPGRSSLSPGRRSWSESLLPPARRSMLESLAPPRFRPRIQAWSPQKVLAVTAAFGLLMLAVVGIASHFAVVGAKRIIAYAAPQTVLEPELPITTPRYRERADAALDREGRSPILGGLLSIPPSFESEDGAYDLVIHFHGNADAVEESFRLARLDAVVVILNLGNGSGVYEDRFATPASLDDVLARVQSAMEKRGLRDAHRRRLALSAWSAGYGAIVRLCDHPSVLEQVDAVLLADGIHVGYMPGGTELDQARLAPWEAIAREAVAGHKLLSITHSDIRPMTYAGTHETTDAVLAAVHVARHEGGEAPEMPKLASIDGVVAKSKLRGLEPESEAREGGLIVRGFTGVEPEDHMAQLFGISATTLHDLAEWWAKKPK
jgi:hypothetical protein